MSRIAPLSLSEPGLRDVTQGRPYAATGFVVLRILSGEFPPGSFVRTLAITKTIGIGRKGVAEAFAKLERLGLVARARGGATILPSSRSVSIDLIPHLGRAFDRIDRALRDQGDR